MRLDNFLMGGGGPVQENPTLSSEAKEKALKFEGNEAFKKFSLSFQICSDEFGKVKNDSVQTAELTKRLDVLSQHFADCLVRLSPRKKFTSKEASEEVQFENGELAKKIVEEILEDCKKGKFDEQTLLTKLIINPGADYFLSAFEVETGDKKNKDAGFVNLFGPVSYFFDQDAENPEERVMIHINVPKESEKDLFVENLKKAFHLLAKQLEGNLSKVKTVGMASWLLNPDNFGPELDRIFGKDLEIEELHDHGNLVQFTGLEDIRRYALIYNERNLKDYLTKSDKEKDPFVGNININREDFLKRFAV